MYFIKTVKIVDLKCNPNYNQTIINESIFGIK